MAASKLFWAGSWTEDIIVQASLRRRSLKIVLSVRIPLLGQVGGWLRCDFPRCRRFVRRRVQGRRKVVIRFSHEIREVGTVPLGVPLIEKSLLQRAQSIVVVGWCRLILMDLGKRGGGLRVLATKWKHGHGGYGIKFIQKIIMG